MGKLSAMLTRRTLLTMAAAGLVMPRTGFAGIDHLPLSTAFKGPERFNAIVSKAIAGNWRALPIGARMGKIAREFQGVPYVGFTLEIDDRIECPSVNCNGLDCWTFFETVLGMARMLERPRATYIPQHLLAEIQWTRYRAGRCSGNYLERLHFLNEWFVDNGARGTVRDITRALGGAERLVGRQSTEMTTLWKSYRYLRNNPALVPQMAKIEATVSALPVYYIPKSKVAAIESKLAEGDIAGIVTKYQGGVCSHVGLIVRDSEGRAVFLHASKNFKKVTPQGTISSYLNTYSSNAGLIVARPLPVASEVRDTA
ncbi:MAG TPA: N-acetylmuramoyl-L-alanine amidase-like domain-containing protein, partial [Verrucomicrobiales bacterium]|nr:N-acetylmuramoyl-L-alanine amidase-like domain-containing protein [Verrucomicrobiales bacterium]